MNNHRKRILKELGFEADPNTLQYVIINYGFTNVDTSKTELHYAIDLEDVENLSDEDWDIRIEEYLHSLSAFVRKKINKRHE